MDSLRLFILQFQLCYAVHFHPVIRFYESPPYQHLTTPHEILAFFHTLPEIRCLPLLRILIPLQHPARYVASHAPSSSTFMLSPVSKLSPHCRCLIARTCCPILSLPISSVLLPCALCILLWICVTSLSPPRRLHLYR